MIKIKAGKHPEKVRELQIIAGAAACYEEVRLDR